ncbi:MAG: glucosaminidase domain-containing protein [Bacteroidota bacterium]
MYIKLLLPLFFLCYFTTTKAASITNNTDSVQILLKQLADLQGNLEIVAYIPETERWYLTMSHDEVPENLLEDLRAAFLYDVEKYCKYYAWKYLLDWRILVSKAARETFWGTSYLSNRARNYFGIRASKDWFCEDFNFCETVMKDDPEPRAFTVFPDFKSSLWMFIHTIYSPHYLNRLPDGGSQVSAAIEFERKHQICYWKRTSEATFSAKQLAGTAYSPEDIIRTWTGYEFNNLCRNCDRKSDLAWIEKIDRIVERAGI